MRRGLGLWLLLLAAYAATLGLHENGAPRISGPEAHRLLVTDSLVHDGDLDVADDLRARRWTAWDGAPLRPAGKVVAGRRVEPAGIGTPLLLAPAYALGGATAAELWCAALLALAFTLGAAIARRVVPDPWATRATLACALSPPALATATTIGPDAAAAAIVTGAALLALKVREQPRIGWAAWTGALLALLPWLSLRAVPLGAIVAVSSTRWLRRRQRAFAGFVAIELVLTSVVLYVSLNDRLYGGLIPGAARAHDMGLPDGDLLRTALLPVWAPVLLLAAAGLWLLRRSHRDRLSVIAAAQVDVEVTAAFCGLLLATAIAVAAALGAGARWPVASTLVVALPATAALVAWGWRFAPRTGAALAALTAAASVWLVVS